LDENRAQKMLNSGGTNIPTDNPMTMSMVQSQVQHPVIPSAFTAYRKSDTAVKRFKSCYKFLLYIA
jgi:hypothetical protein